MAYQTRRLAPADHTSLTLHQWLPDDEPCSALVLVCHGMAEHAARYAPLSQQLNQAGYAVLALDQRGHGQSAEGQMLGHFADREGWNKVTDDLALLLGEAQALMPGKPVFMLGHSMGSYIVQGFLLRHSAQLAGVILSGSNAHPTALSRFGRAAATLEGRLRGFAQPALSMAKLSFGQFNRAFRPARTEFDWLSRDAEQVDRYIADPLCGFPCSARLWQDLFSGLLHIADPRELSRLPSDLSIHIIGGSADPVSAGGGLHKLQKRLQDAGLSQVSLQLYDGARHEILNETNRDQVMQDLIAWLETHNPATQTETPDVQA
ncbi:alpha/beta hydrolase [Halopseudomonas pelagia]|uniref:alpha/beta hydrolase n=1 Tax=Halopseudomonas pelagia TaxID=553151 RepID=UPI0003B5BA99|nr:alpha/beta hydrolase [Halopseudomonas pelagia]